MTDVRLRQNMGAAYGLLLLPFREGGIWLEFRAKTRFSIALQLMF
jgi:hypothetical protein